MGRRKKEKKIQQKYRITIGNRLNQSSRSLKGFPGSSVGRVCLQEMQIPSLGQKDPLENKTAAHPVTLPGEFHGQRSLVGYSPWGHKESDTTE